MAQKLDRNRHYQSKEPILPQLVTTEVASLYLFGEPVTRTKVQRLYRAIQLKQVNAMKVGGTWFIAVKELEALTGVSVNEIHLTVFKC